MLIVLLLYTRNILDIHDDVEIDEDSEHNGSNEDHNDKALSPIVRETEMVEKTSEIDGKRSAW